MNIFEDKPDLANEIDNFRQGLESLYLVKGLSELFTDVEDQDKDAGSCLSYCKKVLEINDYGSAGHNLAIGYKIVYGCEKWLETLQNHLEHFHKYAPLQHKPDVKIHLDEAITNFDTGDWARAFTHIEAIFRLYYFEVIDEEVLKFQGRLADDNNIVAFRSR